MRRLCLLCLGALATAASAAPTSANGVPKALLNKITNGVNLTDWFRYWTPQSYGDLGRLDRYLTPQDFAAFRRLKLKFVRLCVSPTAIYQDGHPNPQVLAHVDRAIDQLERAGLAVIFDFHNEGQLKIDQSADDREGFVTFWQDLARHYQGRRETETVFELVNEPVFQNNPQDWYDLQNRTVKAIRAIDPKRTLMVTSNSWSSIDTLIKMPPVPARNLIYTFHCYDPFFFTHQGASWVGDEPKQFAAMPFPSSPANVAKALAQTPEEHRNAVRQYGEQRYDQRYLYQRLATATHWAHLNRVPVVLGEFGSYPKVAPTQSRTNWFRGMAIACAKLRLPHAIWGYEDAMGLGRKIEPGGGLYLDPLTLRAFYGL